jgi:O-methyltransferase
MQFSGERFIPSLSGDIRLEHFHRTGVWRGGACIMVKAVRSIYGDEPRNIWLADSFIVLPKPNAETYPSDTGDEFHTFRELAVTEETIALNFGKYGLLDEKVRFLKGWFSETLPTAATDTIAVLRLDGECTSQL